MNENHGLCDFLFSAFSQYNMEQFTPCKLEGSDEQVLLKAMQLTVKHSRNRTIYILSTSLIFFSSVDSFLFLKGIILFK